MATGDSVCDEMENLLRHNTDDPAWCGRFINRAMEVGTVTPEQGRSIWNKVFKAGPAPAPLQSDDREGLPRGGAVAWAVIALLVLAGCVGLWLLSEWLAPGTWLR